MGVPVHVNFLVNISICGRHVDLPKATEFENDGTPFRGINFIHTHDDNVIHIEGIVKNKRDVSLGVFFDVIKVVFDKDKILNVRNGDNCMGNPGVFKMFVNNK